MDMLKDLMKKKKSNPLSDHAKKAKMGVLKEIRDMAAEDMGKGIKGLKKVTVASNDEEGLEEGLEKAKELVSQVDGEEESEEAPSAEGKEGESEESGAEAKMADAVESCDDADEIEAAIKMLQEKKAKLSSSNLSSKF